MGEISNRRRWIEIIAKHNDLTIEREKPGDGEIRYHIFYGETKLHTCVGLREAHEWFDGFDTAVSIDFGRITKDRILGE
jgi:hypothetical protein